MPATDTKATAAGVAALCGSRTYTIVEAVPAAFTTITSPAAGQELTSAWILSFSTSSCADRGSWTITLRASLQNYAGVTAVTRTMTATVTNACCTATINSQSLNLTH